MYLDYFGLDKSPFGITPDTSLFFSGAERGDVLDAVKYALQAGEGIIKVVGEVGSGKTMLSRMLVSSADENTEFVFLLNPRVKAEQALFAIAHDLGLVVDIDDKSVQILHELQKKLLDVYQAGKKVVLIIDEAQQMPLSTLEEIRLLSNLETETEKLLQIILFGQPELDEHLDTPQIRQLRERITYSFYLTALDWKLADIYLHFRLRKAGHQGRTIFKSSAIKLLAKCSDGTLRRMNVLADKAMLAAFLDKSPVVEGKHIRLAMKDSQKSNKKSRAWLYIATVLIAVVLTTGFAYWYLIEEVSYKPARVAVNQAQAPTPAPDTSAVAQLPNEPLQEQPKKKTNGDVLGQRLAAYKQWQKTTGKQYTIQLFSAKRDVDGTLVKRYLQRVTSYLNSNQLFVRKLGDKTPGYIVYYQSFGSFSEAKSTLQTLPSIVRQSKPYIQIVPQ